MLDCIIAGDSIAVGAHTFKTECVTYAKSGITSSQFNQIYPMELNATTVVISLGSNDYAGVHTRHELAAVRARTHGRRIFWILPAGTPAASNVRVETIQTIVRDIAAANGDVVVEIPSLQADHIHPSSVGYRAIIDKVDRSAP